MPLNVTMIPGSEKCELSVHVVSPNLQSLTTKMNKQTETASKARVTTKVTLAVVIVIAAVAYCVYSPTYLPYIL
jgi:hypothetical protein